MPESGSSQQLYTRLHDWLVEEGWSIQQAPADDFAWSLVARNPSGVALNVAQPIGKPDQFLVRIGCNIEGVQEHLEKLAPKEREDFLWELRLGLLETEVEFEGVEVPLRNVSIYRTGYVDGLNKNLFMGLVGCVLRGVTTLIWRLTRKFGEALPPTSPWVH